MSCLNFRAQVTGEVWCCKNVHIQYLWFMIYRLLFIVGFRLGFHPARAESGFGLFHARLSGRPPGPVRTGAGKVRNACRNAKDIFSHCSFHLSPDSIFFPIPAFISDLIFESTTADRFYLSFVIWFLLFIIWCFVSIPDHFLK